jgi:tetratricopeptide (TPR) repeat protein
MSAELTRARQQLNQIRSLLKQGKYQPAAQAYHDALLTFLKNPLMKAEKEEFQRLLEDNAHHLNNDKELRKVFPLMIQYAPGKERDILDIIKELLQELMNSAASEAQLIMSMMDKRKQDELERGQKLLDARQYTEASAVFKALVTEFSNDPELKGNIGDRFIKAGRYEEAYEYLAAAIDESPESIHFYNRIGIALRKLGKFDVAEKYFARAVKFAGRDPHLFFNLGRLYVDWKRWDKCAKAACMAIKLSPDFEEAKKMLLFANKKMGKE